MKCKTPGVSETPGVSNYKQGQGNLAFTSIFNLSDIYQTISKYDLSVIIPARNEMFLGLTIEDLLKNIRGKTEIIAILDGYTKKIPELPEAPNLTLIGHTTSVGQRAACNEAASLSQSKYLMKVDAHCSFDEGIDVKMIAEMHDDWTLVPIMYNLHAIGDIIICTHLTKARFIF